MKRFFLSLCTAMSLAAPALAQQLANNGFENWTTMNALERPQNWQTTDDILRESYSLRVLTETVSKTTDSHSGRFAAKLETRDVSQLGAVAGYLILGNRLNTSTGSFGGQPFTGRPAALQLRYKLTGPGAAADLPSVSIFLTRTVNGQSQLVGGGVLLFRPAGSYALATVPVQYSSAQAPDSIRLIINSGTTNTLTPGTTLLVDDLTLTDSVLVTTDEATGTLSIFPNPSIGGSFTLAAPAESAGLRAAFTVSDVTGRVVLAQPEAAPGTNRRAVDLRGQPAGVYTLRLATAKGPVVRRLIVQ